MEIDDFERRYGFPLDPYQVEAIGHLARGSSVLVAAPTGSGKTVIAEYALEMARSEGLKFFYTAPIKALSNQKFRDLSQAYPRGEVGLLTGDNSINGDAPLVVMTTEVLRNMIYEESPVLDRLGVVVLDEVHYMQDPFRGGVWEEIVILLPHRVRLVGLSATVSNAVELGDWMNSLRGGVEVVVSSERPVKLKNHYFVGRSLAPLFSKDLPRIIDEQFDLVKKAQAARPQGKRRRGGPDLRPRRVNVIRDLDKRDMLPAIYFLFSRAACSDSVSMWMREGVSLTRLHEKRQIAEYIDAKLSILDRADLECLNHTEFRSALMSGVAAHHAGQLPLFKEAVEELFSSGLIKVVFATETLSLGINMPARTVVIESLSKWDGDRHRPVTPGEYKQLTGRAGRRGIDEVGYAVVLHQSYFSADQVRTLVGKEPNPVVSSFEVSYNMAVNLLAEHDLQECQRLLNLSFAQYTADRRVVTLEARLEMLDRELDVQLTASRCPEADATRYREIERQLGRLTRKLATMTKDRRRREIKEAMVRLQPGDVFLTGHHADSRALAVVRKHRGGQRDESGVLVVDESGRYRRMTPSSIKHPPRVVGAVDVAKITSPTRKVRRSVADKMETLKRAASGTGQPEPRDGEERELANAVDLLTEEIEKNPCRMCGHNQRCLEAARKVEKSSRQIEGAKKERDSGHDVVSRRLTDVIAVLDEFGFLEGEKPSPRGEMLRRVYNECDLLLVEALEDGALSRLSPREIPAFVSWFIYESRDGDAGDGWQRGPRDLEHMQGALGDVLERVDEIFARMKESEAGHGLDLLGSMDTGFSEAAFLWSGGIGLEEMLYTFPDHSVGNMVRVMKQMIDLMRQLAEVSPDSELRANLHEAMDMVDRGVVGYSSLESMLEHGAEVF
jgi:ATP-dependent RNA helicase HelY